MEKLLDCPFCGKAPEIIYTSGDWGYTPSTVQVKCKCRIAGTPEWRTEDWKEGKGTFSIRDESTAAVVRLWNTRIHQQAAKPVAEGELVERIKACAAKMTVYGQGRLALIDGGQFEQMNDGDIGKLIATMQEDS